MKILKRAYFYILEYGNDVKMMGMQRHLLQDNIVHLCTDTLVDTNQHCSLLYNFPGIHHSLECVPRCMDICFYAEFNSFIISGLLAHESGIELLNEKCWLKEKMIGGR
ncbi:hypothetical protein T11_6846 [Trichinella zimbabwensis]|uniref:Uncharacterized protein n=1 Tax=Trichinella zimbabwensis TaxID=268475 RepID=A0A0V1GZG0_9BILA|nr:hypothetical protein T11_6846 [Trichinella zimbabwensis]